MFMWLLLLIHHRVFGDGLCSDGFENQAVLEFGFEDGTLMGWTGEGFGVSNNTLLKAHSGSSVLTQLQTLEQGYPLLEWNFHGDPGEAVGMDLIEDSTFAHRDGSVLEVPSLGVFRTVNTRLVDYSGCIKFGLDTTMKADSISLTITAAFASILEIRLSLAGTQVGSALKLSVSPDATSYQKDFDGVLISEFFVCRDWSVVGSITVKDFAVEPVERLPSRFVEGQREGADANAATFTGPSGPHNRSTSFILVPFSQVLFNYTIAFWIKTTDVGAPSGSQWYHGKGLVDGRGHNGSDFGVSLVAGKIAFGAGRPYTTIFSSAPINDGAWHSVAARGGSNMLRLYVDGMEVARGTGPRTARGGVSSLTIGASQSLGYPGSLDGMLDDVRVYSSASSEFVQDAARDTHTTAFLPDLVRWLKLDGNVLDSVPAAVQDATATNVLWSSSQGGALLLTNDAVLYSAEFAPLAFEPCFYSASAMFRGTTSFNLGPLASSAHRLTIAVWIRPSDLTSGTKIFDMGVSHSVDRVSLGVGVSRTLEYTITELKSSSKLITSSRLSRNEWVHVSVIHTGAGVMEILLNGDLVATRSLTPAPKATRRPYAYLGASLSSSDPMWAGIIRDFFLWDTAIAHADLARLRNRAAVTVPLSSSLLATSALAFGCAENKFCYSNPQMFTVDFVGWIIDDSVAVISSGTRKGLALAKRLCSLRLDCIAVNLAAGGYQLLKSGGPSLLTGTFWAKQRCGSDVCTTVEYQGASTGAGMLTCPLGTTINSVVFADYGLPSTNLITDGNFSLVKTDTSPFLVTCSFAGNVAFNKAYYAGVEVPWQREGSHWALKFTQKPEGVLSFSASATRADCYSTGLKFVCTTDEATSPWKNVRSSVNFRVQSSTSALSATSSVYMDWLNNSFDDSAWPAPCASSVSSSIFSAAGSTFRQSTAIWGGRADYAYYRISVVNQTTQGTWALQNGEFVVGSRIVSASLCSSNASHPSRLFQTFSTRPFTTYELNFAYYSQVAGARGEVIIEGESPTEPIFFQSAFGPSFQVGSWSNQMLTFVAKSELTTLSVRSTSCIMVDDFRVTTSEACGGFASNPSCYSAGTKHLVEQQCLGRNRCLPNMGESPFQCAGISIADRRLSVLVTCNSTTSKPPSSSSARLLRYDFYNNVQVSSLKSVSWDKPSFSGSYGLSPPQLAQPTTSYHPAHFAVRWLGTFTAPEEGLYSFLLSSKDGSEFYLDDRALIVNDGVHSWKSVGKSVYLAAGAHSIYVRWFYGTASSQTNIFSLFYKPPTTGLRNAGVNCSVACSNRLGPCDFCGSTGRCCQLYSTMGGCSATEGETRAVCVAGGSYVDLPSDLLSQPLLVPSGSLEAADSDEYEPGVAYEYRPISDANDISLERLDFSIAPHRRGVLPYVGIWRMEHEDYFSLRFTGRLRVPQAGLYTFYVHSDDGAVLNLGGSMVVWNDGANDGAVGVQGSIELLAGYYDLEVLYFEGWGNQLLQIEWEGPGMNRQALGTSSLSHRMLMPELNFGPRESFTVETSIMTTAQSRTLVSKLSTFDNGRVDTGWWLQISGGILQFWVAGAQEQRVVSGEMKVNDGQWHHIAAVRDTNKQELRLYVDYREDAVASDPTVRVSLSSQAPLALGLSPIPQDTFEEDVTFDFLKVSTGATSPANFKNSPSTLPRQHPTLILRSQVFRIASPSYSIGAWLVGGAGGRNLVGNSLADLPALSSPTGFLGLALIRLQDSSVVATMRANSLTWRQVVEQERLIPDNSTYYQLLLIDAYHRETSTDRPDWVLVDDIQMVGVAWCSCPDNTTGLHCELSDTRSCKGHGKVIQEGFSSFHCDCDLGWYGEDCSSACPGFHGAGGKDICNGHGQCFLTEDSRQVCECNEAWNRTQEGSGFCSQCSSGWFGSTCAEVCPGGSGDGTCNQHGNCDDGILGKGACACDKNWAGPGCSDSITEVITPALDTIWETGKRYPIVWNSQGFIDLVSILLISGQTQTRLGTVNNTGLFQLRVNTTQATGKYTLRIIGEPSLNTFQDSALFEIREFGQSSATRSETSSNPAGLIVGLSILFLLLLACAALYKFKRVAITEWLLWKLGNFRFHSLRVHREQQEGEPEMADATPTEGTEEEHKPGQHIEMI